MSKKVVHVLGAMNAGGVEAWLMTLLRNTDKGLINHEFIVHHKEKAFYDDEIYSLGSQIHYCQYSANPFVYALNLFRAFKKINPEAVLYCFRGGQRSKISQEWMNESSCNIVRLKGGYKAFRNYLMNELDDAPKNFKAIILGGRTGSAHAKRMQGGASTILSYQTGLPAT